MTELRTYLMSTAFSKTACHLAHNSHPAIKKCMYYLITHQNQR